MEQRRAFRFDGFEFDPATGELVGDGRRLRLEPQPAKVLALLAERAGELVGHDELRRHLWGEETYVDFERGLRYCIGRVRGALGDTADSPRFIETLPRRGYRFLPPVEIVTRPAPGAAGDERRAAWPGSEAPVVSPILASPPPPAAVRRRLAGLVLALVIVAGLAAAVALTRGAGTRASGPVRLAVVPFDNETGLPARDVLARGLSDATVVRLAAIDPGRLAVIGNAAVLFQPRRRRDLTEIGRRLDVQYLVLGQVQGDAGRVRVLAHLIRVADQSHLWATRREADAPDALALQTEIAAEIATAVEARLLAGS